MLDSRKLSTRKIKATADNIVEESVAAPQSIMPVTEMPIADMSDSQYDTYQTQLSESLGETKVNSMWEKLTSIMSPSLDKMGGFVTSRKLGEETINFENPLPFTPSFGSAMPDTMARQTTDPTIANVFNAALIRQRYDNHVIFSNTENEIADPLAAEEMEWANEVMHRVETEKSWLGSRALYEAEEIMVESLIGQAIFHPLDLMVDMTVFGAASKLIGGIAFAGKVGGTLLGKPLLTGASKVLGSGLSKEIIAGSATAVAHESLVHREEGEEVSYTEAATMGAAAGAAFSAAGYLGRWAIVGAMKGVQKTQHTAKLFMDSWNGWHTKKDAQVMHDRGFEHVNKVRDATGTDRVSSTINTDKIEPKLAEPNQSAMRDATVDPYEQLPKYQEESITDIKSIKDLKQEYTAQKQEIKKIAQDFKAESQQALQDIDQRMQIAKEEMAASAENAKTDPIAAEQFKQAKETLNSLKEEKKVLKQKTKEAGQEIIAKAKSAEEVYKKTIETHPDVQIKLQNEQKLTDTKSQLINEGQIFDISRLHDAGLFRVEYTENGQAIFNKKMPLTSEEAINEYVIDTYKGILDGKKTIDEKLRYLINMFGIIDANKTALQNIWFVGGMMNEMIPKAGLIDTSVGQMSRLMRDKDINKAIYNHIVKGEPLDPKLPSEVRKLVENLNRVNADMIADTAQRGYAQHYRRGHIEQTHQANKLLAFSESEWLQDIKNAIDLEKSKIWTDKKGQQLSFKTQAEKDAHVDTVLKAIRENIIENYGMIESNTIAGIGSRDMRVLEFKDYEGWSMYQNKYGHGKGVLESEVMKINGRAAKNAMLSILGPDPFNAIKTLSNHVLAEKNETLHTMSTFGKIPTRVKWWTYSKGLEQMINFHFGVTGASKYVGLAGDIGLTMNSFNNYESASMLKNASSYPIIEAPIASALETSRLLSGNGAKRLFQNLTDYFKFSPDKREMAKLGAIYQLDTALFPNLYIEQLTDKSGKGLKQTKAVLDTATRWQTILNTTDFFHNRNKSITARQFDGEIGWLLADNTNWSDLNPVFKESINRWGVTEKDWKMLLEHREKTIVTENPYWTDELMSDIQHHNFSVVDALKNPDLSPEFKNVLKRMMFAREKHISRAVIEASPSSTGFFLGSHGKAKDKVWSQFIRNFTAFQGWAFKEALNSIENLDFRTRGNTATKLTSYMAQKFMTGTMMTLYRHGLRGRMPDDYKSWAIEISSYMGIPFLSDLPKTFLADHAWNGGGLDEILGQQILQSAIGRGTGKGIADQAKLASAAYEYFYKNDAAKAFKLLRYSLPESDYLFVGQLLMQRAIMDPLFAHIDPRAYALFESEKRKAKDRGIPYMEGLEPGAWVD